MKTLYTLITVCFTMATIATQAQDVNITFNVNMANETVDPSGVFLAGGGPDCFGNPGENAMNDDDMDGVWTITVTRPMGFSCPYTFTNGNCPGWDCKENIAGQDCATGEFSDRLLDPVMSDTVINTCFGECTTDGSCPPPSEAVNVTFQVDMSEQGLVAEDVVYITGGSIDSWCGTCTPLSDDDMDGVFEVTLEMDQGLHEYKYVINAWGPDGGADETFSPAEDADCTLTTGGFTNRVVTVGANDMVLDVNCYEGCGPCGTQTPAYDITFQVDMSDVTDAFTTPEVNGTFNEWCGACNPMTDQGGGIWSTTINLTEGDYEYKFSADNWTIQEELAGIGNCVVEADGFTNRPLTVAGADMTLTLVCWQSCATCDNSVYELEQEQVGVYPNPVKEGTVFFNSNITQNVEVFNAFGVHVKSVELTAGTTSLDVSELAKGAYFLKGTSGRAVGTFIIVD